MIEKDRLLTEDERTNLWENSAHRPNWYHTVLQAQDTKTASIVAREIFEEIENHNIRVASTTCINYETGASERTYEPLSVKWWWKDLKQKWGVK